MIERICEHCQAGNPIEVTHCGECGAAFEYLPAPPTKHALARPIAALPTRWREAGKVAALGAVALAVELGAAWLHQRAANKNAPLARIPQHTPNPTRASEVVVARRRVWESYENGNLTRRVVEQTVWRWPDDQP